MDKFAPLIPCQEPIKRTLRGAILPRPLGASVAACLLPPYQTVRKIKAKYVQLTCGCPSYLELLLHILRRQGCCIGTGRKSDVGRFLDDSRHIPIALDMALQKDGTNGLPCLLSLCKYSCAGDGGRDIFKVLNCTSKFRHTIIPLVSPSIVNTSGRMSLEQLGNRRESGRVQCHNSVLFCVFV